MSSQRKRSDRGAVTAEIAIGLPVLLGVTAAMSWLLAVGAAQVRTIDAAREAARAAARGDGLAAAATIGEGVAPKGVQVEVVLRGDRVTAVARGHVEGPDGIFRFLPGAELHAEATAVAEVNE